MIIHGVDVNSVIRPLLVNANGSFILAGLEPSLLNPTPENVEFITTALAAGSTTFGSTTVPAGEVWRLTGFSAVYTGTAGGVSIDIRYTLNGTVITLYTNDALATNRGFHISLFCILDSGTVIEGRVRGATANDDLSALIMMEHIYNKS